MAKLKTEQRKKLKPLQFGMPKEKKYPMPDKVHAANAKSRASQMFNKGKLSEANKEKIVNKANNVLKNKTKNKKG